VVNGSEGKGKRNYDIGHTKNKKKKKNTQKKKKKNTPLTKVITFL